MSDFVNVVYTQDDGATKNRLRMSKDDAAAQPTAYVKATASTGAHVRIQKSNRAFGFHPRKLRLFREVTDGTLTKVYYDSMVVLLKADAATLLAAGTVNIGANVWSISSLDGEFSR